MKTIKGIDFIFTGLAVKSEKMRCVLFSVLLFSNIGCNTTAAQSEDLYAKLMIALGESSLDKIQCVAEFMKDPDDLKTVALSKGSIVFIDSNQLNFDGTYSPTYVLELEPDRFVDNHKWAIVLDNQQRKEYDLTVVSFTLKTEIPAKIGKEDVKIECENLLETDRVHLMISGELSAESETSLEIKPANGYFVIPREFLQKVDPVKVEIHFNLTRNKVLKDTYFKKGVEIEWTKVTRKYVAQVVR